MRTRCWLRSWPRSTCGLLTHLLTVTHLGRLTAQVHQQREVSAHQEVTLLPMAPTPGQLSEQLSAAVRSLYDLGNEAAALALFDDETSVACS